MIRTLRLFGLVAIGGLCSTLACSAPDQAAETSEDAIRVRLDPARRYEDRERLVTILQTRHPLPVGIDDPRVGIRAMTEWQRVSGRGTMERDRNGLLTGWYSVINYHINVVQLVALHRRGEMLNVVVNEPDGPLWAMSEREVASSLSFYDAIDHAYARSKEGPIPAKELDQMALAVRIGLWAQHDDSLAEGSRLSKASFKRMPEGEQEFGRAFAFAFEPIMSAIHAPPSRLDTIVPRYFPNTLFGATLNDLPNATLEERTFVASLGGVARLELGFSFLQHPIRNAARHVGDSLSPARIDPLFDKFVADLGRGEDLAKTLTSWK